MSINFTVCDIKNWVKALFQDEEIDIPEFTGNTECMKLMSAIMSFNKEANKDAKEIIKTELYLAECYAQKSSEIYNSVISEISVKDLPPDVVDDVSKIASLSVQMKVKKPTITNFLLSSAVLENKKKELSEQEMLNTFSLSKLSKKINTIMQKNAVLQRNIDTLEKIVCKQQNLDFKIESQCEFTRIKGEEYQKRIKKSEKKLRSLGWDSSLTHSELVKRAEAVQCLEQMVNSLASKLESYENLPPNEISTQLKIEEAQAELLRLQNEFENLLKTCP